MTRPVEAKSNPCLIYTRVSSTKQTSDGAGLASQERSCREYAALKGYEVAHVFADVVSGKALTRPGMTKLLELLKANQRAGYVVVIDDITRLARDVATHVALRTDIMKYGATIESPKQKFGEDAGAKLVENLLAAVAAHDREKNAEQSSSRSHARLRNGFWIFHPPLGYRFEKAAGGGKWIVPVEPLASIITEALEGFAIGRFQSQTEVKRFLESKPEFPGRDRWGEVKIDRVKTILTCVLYAGWLEYPKWGIPLVEAQHQPLISYDTYLRVQRRLNTKSVAAHRKDLDAEFPLRGFLVCGCCGYRLTACWSTSHTGRKYPYYLCHHRGCAERRKSIPRAVVEAHFDDL